MFRLGRFEMESRPDWCAVALRAPILVNVSASAFVALGHARAWRWLARLQRRWSSAVLRALRVDVTVVGAHRLTPGPVVMLPLHEGFVDVPLLMSLGRSLRFVARDELFAWKHLGRVLRSGGHLLVPESPSRAELRSLRDQARQTVAAGHDLVVFPQGSILGIEVAFAPGARRLAAWCEVPVVPIVITGTHQVWDHPFSSLVRRRRPVRMEILGPIAPDDLAGQWSELTATMQDIALAQHLAPARRFDPKRDGWWDDYDFEIDPRFEALRELVETHRSQCGDQTVGIVGADEKTTA